MLLAAVMVNLLIPGTIKSFGVLFVEFLDVFDASPAAAAWIPSLCYFLYSSLGKKRAVSRCLEVRGCFFFFTPPGFPLESRQGLRFSAVCPSSAALRNSAIKYLGVSRFVYRALSSRQNSPSCVYISKHYSRLQPRDLLLRRELQSYWRTLTFTLRHDAHDAGCIAFLQEEKEERMNSRYRREIS